MTYTIIASMKEMEHLREDRVHIDRVIMNFKMTKHLLPFPINLSSLIENDLSSLKAQGGA